MSRCKKCNVEILDQAEHCPFCRSVLDKSTGSIEGKKAYPDARVLVKKYRLFLNIVLFSSLLLGTFLLFLDYMLGGGVSWSIIALMILIYGNVVLQMSFSGKSGYKFKIFFLTMFTVAILVGIDFYTNYRGWSLGYVLPIAIMGIDITILVLMIVNHRNWQSYLMPQLIMILISIVALVMVLVGLVPTPWFAVAALAMSVFLFLGTVIIGDKRAHTELYRRFHI